MVKTHPYSRFALRSLDQIRDSSDVILQMEITNSTFSDTKQSVYLCEVVSPSMYNRAETVEVLTAEVVRLNADNRKLLRKIATLERRCNQ